MAVAIGRQNQANSRDPNAQNYCQPGVQATADDATWGEISGFKRSVTSTSARAASGATTASSR